MATTTLPPPWFTKAIADGLTRMYAATLPYAPAHDVFEATVAVWTEDLWNHLAPSSPTEQVDAPRIAQGFRALRLAATSWPPPALFLHHLPKRPEPKRPPALAAPELSEAERARRTLENIKRREQLGLRLVDAAGGEKQPW